MWTEAGAPWVSRGEGTAESEHLWDRGQEEPLERRGGTQKLATVLPPASFNQTSQHRARRAHRTDLGTIRASTRTPGSHSQVPQADRRGRSHVHSGHCSNVADTAPAPFLTGEGTAAQERRSDLWKTLQQGLWAESGLEAKRLDTGSSLKGTGADKGEAMCTRRKDASSPPLGVKHLSLQDGLHSGVQR